jgi:hypothetical protein
MFLGLGGYANINISNTATVTVHSPSIYDVEVDSATWLDNNFPLVVSTLDLPVEPFRPLKPRAGFVRVRLDSKGHVQNLLAGRATGSRSGR